MKFLLATLTLAAVAAFATPTPADALNFEEIRLDAISFPIHGVTRARNGAAKDGCSRQLTFEVTNENAAYELEKVLVSSYLKIDFVVGLPNGRKGTLRLLGVRVLNFGPATLYGQKGWRGTICYDRQVLRFGGEDLGDA